ncbi:hypothetical protein AVEN_36704-1 [Araneus ventricosus]|uniref:Uncharacterized protein n=1 Tax=Araneus ventricosus TaxID=182803 RepID=A0A4Y2ATD6_ARAVE|nr:hypothetical protein AVEN_36704-1 [Araneus ventricosus]
MAGLSSLISPLRVPLITTRPTAFSPLSEQQPAETRPTSIEVAWTVTAGLGVRVLKKDRMSLNLFEPLFQESLNLFQEPRGSPCPGQTFNRMAGRYRK